MQRGFTIFDIESQLDSIQIRSCPGVLLQGPVKSLDHLAGEALPDLCRYRLCRALLTLGSRAHTSARTPLLEAGATHPTFIDKLERTDLRV